MQGPRRLTHIGWVQAELKRLILQQAAVSVHRAIAWVLLAQQLLVSVVTQGLQLATAAGVCHAVEPMHCWCATASRSTGCLLLCCLCSRLPSQAMLIFVCGWNERPPSTFGALPLRH